MTFELAEISGSIFWWTPGACNQFLSLEEFESSLKSYHAIGPGESFWFLVDTRAGQILPIVLGMALACDKSGLVGKCFFYNFYLDDPLLYLLAL